MHCWSSYLSSTPSLLNRFSQQELAVRPTAGIGSKYPLLPVQHIFDAAIQVDDDSLDVNHSVLARQQALLEELPQGSLEKTKQCVSAGYNNHVVLVGTNTSQMPHLTHGLRNRGPMCVEQASNNRMGWRVRREALKASPQIATTWLSTSVTQALFRRSRVTCFIKSHHPSALLDFVSETLFFANDNMKQMWLSATVVTQHGHQKECTSLWVSGYML